MYQIKRFIKYTFIFNALIALVYWSLIRAIHINWGATPADVSMSLPGGEFISSNRIVSTRAITIHATKEEIWPWIAQTGQNRGGFNSYYWLENLFGAKMVNADSAHSEWQNPQPGDTVYYGKNEGYAVVSLVKLNEYYSLGGWTFYLQPLDANNTRLIVRYPSMEIRQSKLATLYYYGLFEPLHFIMESGMMIGIKQRAEKQ
ncbi:hypothetical protein [Segetibacter sp.]|uniref:hypothetical protein n=1 Tax=Segetibacter sp. TaxID=2231182 RepID=UPI00260401E7|nr:hypothetical protein [Segetibacter sp.]MCW3081082.1 hypothetical protein [Segetibacter sp.]